MSNSQKPGFLLKSLSVILIPIFLLLFTIIFTLTSPSFYTGLLKRADLVSVFAKDGNSSIENSIQTELDKYPARKEQKKILEKYEDKYLQARSDFDVVNKTKEYEELNRKLDEVERLQYHSILYSSKKAYRLKKRELAEPIKNEIIKIDNLRNDRKKIIGQLSEKCEELSRLIEEQRASIVEMDENAMKIIKEKKGSATGKFYHDLDVVSPVMEKVLDKFFDQELAREIGYFFDFISSYKEQVAKSNIYYRSSKNREGEVVDELCIRLPDFYFNLMVDDSVDGVVVKRHLFDDIMVEEIDTVKDQMHYAGYFKKIFSFTDSRIIEKMISRYAKGFNIVLKRGLLHVKPYVVRDDDAIALERVMRRYSYLTSIKYLLLIIPLLLFIVVIKKSKGSGAKRKMFVTLFYVPSILAIIGVVLMWFFAGSVIGFYLPEYNTGIIGGYLRSGSRSVIFNLFFLSSILFISTFLLSLIFKKSVSEKVNSEDNDLVFSSQENEYLKVFFVFPQVL